MAKILVARKAYSANLNGRRGPPNQPLFQQNLPQPDIRDDDFPVFQRAVPHQ
jgi:hypothetical protein